MGTIEMEIWAEFVEVDGMLARREVRLIRRDVNQSMVTMNQNSSILQPAKTVPRVLELDIATDELASQIPPDTGLAGRTLSRKAEFTRDQKSELDFNALIRGGNQYPLNLIFFIPLATEQHKDHKHRPRLSDVHI